MAVHPEDARYEKYIGKTYTIEDFCGTKLEIKIIADKEVDPLFGTGALGVTPAHSMIDWEMADRHDLPRPQVINEYAKMSSGRENLLGKKTTEAREIIVEWLKKQGLLEKEEEIKQNISTAERTGGIVEPLPKLQWFINVNKPIKERGDKTLKDLMREPFEKEEIQIIPDYFSKTYFHWIENLRDWCISRQIWYGHQIPVWYRKNEIYCGIEAPIEKDWVQDEDTLDTWFSSGLWTFSTLGWPEKTKDLKTYHPTDVLETGYEILFFWIARMVLMTEYVLGEIPFKKVFLHGTVRDGQGRKMSKSLGNGIDPLDVAQKFGADAGRMALVVGTAPGTDSRIDENKIKGYKNFDNKIWNITRFVLDNVDKKNFDNNIQNELTEEFKKISEDITLDMENYRFHLASEKIYQYVWHRFADEIIEESKKIIKLGGEKGEERKNTLTLIWKDCLKILHPFIPFVTEEIWSILPNKKNLLMVEKWPI